MDWSSWGLAGVAVLSFLSSTVLPGTSEGAVAAYSIACPGNTFILWLTAGTMNTLGSMTSWAIGRYWPNKKTLPPKVTEYVRRWGAFALFFAWLPVVGDAIAVAAGFFGIHWLSALFWTAAGKFLRYAIILGLIDMLQTMSLTF